MTKLNEITGRKFVEEILNGRTYFTEIELEPNFNLNLFIYENQKKYSEIHRYLNRLNVEQKGLCILTSRIIGLNISNFELNYFAGNGTDFKGSNFSYSRLNEAHFYNAKLKQVDFKKAVLHYATFNGADLRGAKNLEEAIGLETSKYKRIIVTSKEERIIRKHLFDVRKN